MKEEEDAAKEAFNGTTFAQLFFGPSRGQTGAIFLALGVPKNHRHRAQGSTNPDDELQASIGGIQANQARADLIEMHGPSQQRLSKGSIMDIGRGKQKEEWQTRSTTDGIIS